MVSLVALIIWQIPLSIVILGFLTFGALDGLYLSSALTKVPDGAWFTLILAVILSSIFVLWRFGKEKQWQAEASDHLELSSIIVTKTDHQLVAGKGNSSAVHFTAGYSGAFVSTINGMGVFFDKSGLPNTTPTVFIHYLLKFQAAPRVAVFFHIRPLSSPSVPPEDRFSVSRCGGHTYNDSAHQFFRVTLRHGYTDEVITQDLGLQIYDQLRSFVQRDSAIPEQASVVRASTSTRLRQGDESPTEDPSSISEVNQLTSDTESPTAQQERIQQQLSALQVAFRDQVVYVVGKEQMRIREVTGCKPRSWFRRIALAAFLWIRSNTGSKIANLNIDVDKLVEIGFVKII
ncbi:MAG: hypothetical protein Q9170_000400 [Blastenia crenularia]